MPEITPLLDNSRPPHISNGSRVRCRLSPQTLLIPVAVGIKLASSLPSTTFIGLLRRAICELWIITHTDRSTPSGRGPVIPGVCDTPEVTKYYATVVAIIGVIESIISIAVYGFLSRILSQNRRKPILSAVLIIRIVGCFLVPASQYAPDRLAGWSFVVGTMLYLFSELFPCSYLIDVYILDVCTPENRTAALSRIAGWSSLGKCISLATGGIITTKTGNPFIVFYVSTAIFAAAFVYVLFVLPESLSREKRAEQNRVIQERSNGRSKPTLLFVMFEPLKMLTPTHNWRLAWCGMHTFVYMVAHSYIYSAWTVLATSKHHLTPADLGLFFTSMTTSSTIVLTLVVPWLVRSLRPYYCRRIRSFTADQDASCNREPESETSDRLDVHLAFFSCVVAGIFNLSAAAFMTSRALIFSGVCLGIVYVRGPTIRSLVGGSVEPQKQGEALAAIEMVINAGSVLSSIVMGTILAQTIETIPLLVFYVHLVVVVISGALLFLVRDVDRYQKQTEE